MATTKRYWQDLGELSDAPQVPTNEFNQPLALPDALGDKSLTGATTGRRDFLKFLGFSLSAATLAACETPVIKSIPYVTKPEDIIAGVANWYASTFYDGEDYGSVLVKTREGRPIHIQGNPRFGINLNTVAGKGNINARIISSVIGLYDSHRLKGPMMRTGENAWNAVDHATADKAIVDQLAKAAGAGKKTVLLTSTVISPSAKAAISAFQTKYGNVSHVQYDSISYSGLTNANLKSFGQRVFPSYDLTKADVVVGIGADFLSGWGSTNENTWQYAVRRNPENLSRHWQFEARMSLTGANADERVMIRPSQVPAIVIALYDAVARKMGGAAIGGGAVEGLGDRIEKCASELVAAKGKSVVLCGHNDEGTQTIVNGINVLLGNYGSTIDLADHTNFFQGDDNAVQQLVKDMNAGSIGALFIAGVNPVYTLPNGAEFAAGLGKVGLSVSFSAHADETASKCSTIFPDHHWLESWNDHMPKPGHYALSQPTINPLFNTRQWPASLLTWSGVTGNYHDHVKATFGTFADWSRSVEEGGAAVAKNALAPNAAGDTIATAVVTPAAPAAFAGDLAAAAISAKKSTEGAGAWEVEVYTSEGIGSGLHANNPWLQELPDPITKVTWDNYVGMAPADLLELTGKKHVRDLRIGEQEKAYVVRVTANGVTLELPAVPVPGQTPRTVSVALGYGRGANGEDVGRAASLRDPNGNLTVIGKSAYPMTRIANGTVCYSAVNGTLENTGARYEMGLTQTQLTGMDRHSIIKETTIGTWRAHDPRGAKDSKNGYNEKVMLAVHEDVNHDGHIDARDKVPATEVDLWGDHPVEQVGHHWGMSIDLNACNGCGACITACHSENNVPVVGKDEVRRSRDMHWLRLDRYYSSDMTHEVGKAQGMGKIDRYLAMEEPSASPSVFFMPVMCQHCDHAPCETVCPVAATSHSNEGLNMMAYNRCIGTRYCANNCPYKVRRFNWFNYVTEQFGEVNPAWDELGRLVLNPDVVVRSRGVIEKCSLCVQRIQEVKLTAKKAGRPVKDGEVQTACSTACGTGAIVFGDLNDANSKVAARFKDERAYFMLEEIGVKPNVSYLAKVWNREEPPAIAAVTEEAHH